MSSENGDQVLRESPSEPQQEFQQRKSRRSYTREFLLSLSELGICKELPSGFDASILSEFQGASSSIPERQRSLGALSLQSSRHNDYGSLPTNRSDSSSGCPRGSTGRWDTRSSGSSDRDGDLPSERDLLDSGRRFGNQPRRFWQHPEHDGLLGSGAFPRPSGYAGASTSRARGNDHCQLNRSTEPYQPPRPYKAGPYSRKDNNTDSVNDETFGSAECTSEDRVEEERKRRASFELMRKEQQKALQEKQMQNPDNQKEKLDADLIALLEKSEDEKIKKKDEKPDVSAPSLLQNDSSRFPPHVQPPASRPLVPPGFASAILEKNLVQSSSTSIEVVGAATQDSVPLENYLDKKSDLTAGIEAFKDSVGLENVSKKASGPQEVNEICVDNVVDDLSDKKESMYKVVDTVSQDHSASILEKLFGGALPKNNDSSPHFVEHQDVIVNEETQSPVTKSSKFAHWFLEDEKRPTEDLSSRNLFSLIVSNERIGSEVPVVSDYKVIELAPSTIPCENEEASRKLLEFTAAPSVPEPYYQTEKRTSSSVVLTCQDLEQFILAEVKESSSNLQHSIRDPWTTVDGSSEEQKVDVDDNASRHLLSLLQEGPNSKESISFSNADDTVSFEKHVVPDIKASPSLSLVESAAIENSERVQNSEKTLTLEALFGAAFMNELHSVGTPVSAQRGSVSRIDESSVTQPHGMSFPQVDGAFVSSTPDEHQFNKVIIEGSNEAFSRTQEAKCHKIPGLWLGNEESSLEGSKIADKGYEEGAVDLRLPEEDSLITVADSLDPIASDSAPFRGMNRTEIFLPEKAPEEHNGSLLKTVLQEGEMGAACLGGPSLVRGPYDLVESDNLYHHLHGRLSSQFPQEMNHMRPLFSQMDQHSNRNPQMKLMGLEGIRQDPHHPFPPNFIPQHAFPNTAGSRFDPPHHPLLQHMPVPGNFPSHHLLQGLPRGIPLSHPVNQMPGYVPEMNNIHGFPLNHRQPNYGGPGMGMPGGAGGGGNPEVLQRLFEMELRANQKQTHPVAAGHIPGIFGPEHDMNFRYR